jgi:4-alpha-glucanotransferase
MKLERSGGILFHPTSLPGPYGIGDLGPQAFRWIDFLVGAGCKLWQVLPLGPTGYGDSPYQCFSSFAGNPYLVSPDILLEDGLLAEDDLADRPDWPEGEVDFGEVFDWKPALLDRAYARFEDGAPAGLRDEFEAFRTSNASWLDDFALFMALKDVHDGAAWNEWEAPLRTRDEPKAIAEARGDHVEAVARHSFDQWLFYRQWKALRRYAHERGVRIIGDAPIFVALDSADVWSHPELFYLDESSQPTVVAGVPPDYFSPTGQLWGNPLYRWDVHKRSGYAWWIARLRAVLAQVDVVRLDHFRGFVGYWEVPAGNPTAEIGRWVPGPGADLFTEIDDALGNAALAPGAGLPIIAEDLGVITDEVIALRERFELPGMKILQFAFSGPDNDFLPHLYPRCCVAYTGTHDNDTAWGWYRSAPEAERDFARRYMHCNGSDFAWDLIRGVWGSVAAYAVAPLQDFLDLGTEARMNFPGKPGGNWAWRVEEGALDDALRDRIRELNYLYQR